MSEINEALLEGARLFRALRDNPERKPTLEELRILYRRNVCSDICDLALELLPENILKNSIAYSLYTQNIERFGADRVKIMKQIQHTLSMGYNSVKRHVPSVDHPCHRRFN